MHRWKRLGGGLVVLALVVVAGCGGDTAPAQKTGAATGKVADGGKGSTASEVVKSQSEPNKSAKVDDHSGWWCPEHGIPEEECSMCSDKVAKEAKAKGDWCEKHERAMSQCFICKPERREFYAAKHRAKLGKDPPPIEEFDAKKDEKKG